MSKKRAANIIKFPDQASKRRLALVDQVWDEVSNTPDYRDVEFILIALTTRYLRVFPRKLRRHRYKGITKLTKKFAEVP